MSLSDAKAALDGLAVDVHVTTVEDYSKKAEGTVLNVTPAVGEFLAPGQTVVLVIAKPYVKVPNVVGMTESKAKSTLKGKGFGVSVKHQTAFGAAGIVLTQKPTAGSLRNPDSTTVTIYITKRPAPTPTPTPMPTTICTPGYSPCLPLHGYADYDCTRDANGPYYTDPGVTYRVTGSDPYGLDSDNDGYGCE
jgi:beta-lactam-binding protein with PASTA domain